tara:strand:- start:243 stop:386 length:144 start_codon:yes stop_codon:yes gene_type:complete
MTQTEGTKMQYLGSKNRLSKELLSIIEKERQFAQAWVEPFVGGCKYD